MLSSDQMNRASGVLVTMAAGDALGAGYEFGPALPEGSPVVMRTGNLGFAPGEWTDDTDMAIVLAQALLEHGPGTEAETAMVQGWSDWAMTARDVGIQTRQVLRTARLAAEADGRRPISMEDAVQASQAVHRRSGRSAGNGSLMRTAPVALAFLEVDPEQLFHYAADVGRLTHWEDDAQDACGLWSVAIRHAVLTGTIDVRQGFAYLPGHRRDLWAQRLRVAESSNPRDFGNNGWVVEALQSAWSAITITRDLEPSVHVTAALETAVRGGNDADTVAAIAGALLGAAYGPSAVDDQWLAILHGWPGLRGGDLVSLATGLATAVRAPVSAPRTASLWQRLFDKTA